MPISLILPMRNVVIIIEVCLKTQLTQTSLPWHCLDFLKTGHSCLNIENNKINSQNFLSLFISSIFYHCTDESIFLETCVQLLKYLFQTPEFLNLKWVLCSPQIALN